MTNRRRFIMMVPLTGAVLAAACSEKAPLPEAAPTAPAPAAPAPAPMAAPEPAAAPAPAATGAPHCHRSARAVHFTCQIRVSL